MLLSFCFKFQISMSHCAKVQKYVILLIKILYGCPFEGWPPIQPISRFLPKRVGWPCPVRSALKRTPMQDFNYFSIMFYYIFSTTYQRIGDLFCPVIFLDFRTVCRANCRIQFTVHGKVDTFYLQSTFVFTFWKILSFFSNIRTKWRQKTIIVY